MDLELPYKWVKEYLTMDMPVEEFCAKMSLGGPSIEKWNYNKILDDYILDIEVTTNRVDMANIVGMAREAKAILGVMFKQPTFEFSFPSSSKYEFEIKNLEFTKAPRYQAVIMDNIKVGKSPEWLSKRLEALGINSINNLVDISNYVLIEYGQPTHIFDYFKIKGNQINIRSAREGETFVSLDNKSYKLESQDLVIADGSDPIALGGVKGGISTGVTTSTNTIVIESANFEPTNIRQTARRHDLHTDASRLFEKGLNSQSTEVAIKRVIELVQLLTGGKIASPIYDQQSRPFEERIINYNTHLTKRVLGIDISVEEITEILERLEFVVEPVKSDLLRVTVPYFRNEDIIQDYDIVEEIARIYGYHKIPSILPATKLSPVKTPLDLQWEETIKDILLGAGFNETFTYGMINEKHLESIGLATDDVIALYNPLSSDFQYMKRELASTMIENIAINQDNHEVLNLFELNRVFIPLGLSKLPDEKSVLAIAISNKLSNQDLYEEAKGVWELILEKIGINIYDMNYEPGSDLKIFDKNSSAQILNNGQVIGDIGIVADSSKEVFGVKNNTAIVHIDFSRLFELITRSSKSFTPIPKYPSVKRDIACLVDVDTNWRTIYDLVSNNGEGLIAHVEPFDIYQGKGIPDGKKSIAFSIIFRSLNSTLRDEQVNQIMTNITRDLENNLGAKIR